MRTYVWLSRRGLIQLADRVSMALLGKISCVLAV